MPGRWRGAVLMAALAGIALPAAAAAAPGPADAILPLPLYPAIPADKRYCAQKTASGLGYTVLRAGQGASPPAGAVSLINYIGYLAADGQTFDQAMGVPMEVDGVIPGFAEGLKLMSKGAIYRLCLPATLAYGATAQGPIPANSALVFQVELLEFKTAEEIEAMRQARAANPRP